MWRRTLQPQALNLVRVLPVDNAGWISARISTIPQFAASLRYWMELRDDVLILYPALQLLDQHQQLIANPPADTTPFTLKKIDDTASLEKLPADHVLSIAELVPTPHVVTFVLPAVRISCREHTRTIHLRGPGLRVAAAHLILDSRPATARWREDLNQAIRRDRKRLSDFRVLRHVGKGASGRVYEIEDKVTSERLALKVIEKTTVFESKDTYRHAMDERLVLQIIRHHPYILDMRYAFQNAKRLFLVTEYCSGGDLFEYMNHRVAPLDENTARFISAQVLLALAHLHHLGIVYRDLKLENILIDNHGHVRLADFGLTKVLRQHDGKLARTNTFCGTREYVAPEMLRGDSYDTSLDFWTFGILLYEMLAGRTPFYTSDHSEIYRRIEKSPVFYPRHLSPEARSLLSKLLVRDPSKRLGATKGGINAIFRHSWYKAIEWETMMDRDSLESPLKRTITFQQRQHENRKRFAEDKQQQGNSTQSKPKKQPSSRQLNKYYDEVHMYHKPSKRKSRKELKQERAFANVLADVQADLRYASTRYNTSAHVEKSTLSAGSFSGSLLGLGRQRSPMGRSGDLVLAGYSFYDSHQRAFSEHDQHSALAMNSSRSASATFSSRSQWMLDGEQTPDLDQEMDSRAYHVFDEGPSTSKSASAANTESSMTMLSTTTTTTMTSLRRDVVAKTEDLSLSKQPSGHKSNRSIGYKRPQPHHHHKQSRAAVPSIEPPMTHPSVNMSPSASEMARSLTTLPVAAKTKSTLANSSPVSWPGIIARSLSCHSNKKGSVSSGGNGRINSSGNTLESGGSSQASHVGRSNLIDTRRRDKAQEERRRHPHTPKVSEATLDDDIIISLDTNMPLGALHMADEPGLAATAVELRDVAHSRTQTRETLRRLTAGMANKNQPWEDELDLTAIEGDEDVETVPTVALDDDPIEDDDEDEDEIQNCIHNEHGHERNGKENEESLQRVSSDSPTCIRTPVNSITQSNA